MTATAAPTARPTRAAIAWASRDALYVEIPCRDGPPYIARYRKTADGLAAALNILVEHDDPTPRQPQAHPAVKKVPQGTTSRAPWANEAQRELTRNILKKHGIT